MKLVAAAVLAGIAIAALVPAPASGEVVCPRERPIEQPYVIGALWNGQSSPAPGSGAPGVAPTAARLSGTATFCREAIQVPSSCFATGTAVVAPIAVELVALQLSGRASGIGDLTVHEVSSGPGSLGPILLSCRGGTAQLANGTGDFIGNYNFKVEIGGLAPTVRNFIAPDPMPVLLDACGLPTLPEGILACARPRPFTRAPGATDHLPTDKVPLGLRTDGLCMLPASPRSPASCAAFLGTDPHGRVMTGHVALAVADVAGDPIVGARIVAMRPPSGSNLVLGPFEPAHSGLMPNGVWLANGAFIPGVGTPRCGSSPSAGAELTVEIEVERASLLKEWIKSSYWSCG